MLVLKIAGNEWNNASRDKRELSVYREMGYDIVVMAKGKAEDHGRTDYVDGFRVLRYTTRPLGSKIPASINRLCASFLWAKAARTMKADIISGHDMDGWIIGWLSRLCSGHKKPAMVYDSHEFELGRNTIKKRSKWQLAKTKLLERFVIKHSAFTIVVNESIRDELVKIYGLKERPVVVRNIPNKTMVDPAVCTEIRQEIDRQFGCEGFVLIYHGAISRNRGIEQLLTAVRDMPDIHILLLGNPESERYMDTLQKEYIEYLGNRAFVKGAVPHKELWKYVGAADICVVPIIPSCRSYYYALPNKLFEAIQAQTPVLATDLPEMRKLIDHFRIGLVCEPENLHSLSECIRKMKEDRVFYQQCKNNIQNAKNELCWEKEKGILAEAVNRYLLK